jgi:hypothetical protein
MLPGMHRLAVVALLIGGCAGCGKPANKAAEPTGTGSTTTGPEEKVGDIPGVTGSAADKPTATAGAPANPDELTDEGYKKAQDNKSMHLTPDEATLTVGKAEGKAGAAAAADIKLTPGQGFHVSQEFPIKLKLMSPSGVKLDKNVYVAGKGGKGDAAALTEQLLELKVNATAAAAGTYEIKGVLNVGVCEKDSCHPRSQPITIQVAAK